MKYSVRGKLNQDVSHIIAKYPLWKPIKGDGYSFEILLNAENDKNMLVNTLKDLVQVGEWIDWHTCTEDENIPKPCIIAETFSK
jgi:hypothetical protein